MVALGGGTKKPTGECVAVAASPAAATCSKLSRGSRVKAAAASSKESAWLEVVFLSRKMCVQISLSYLANSNSLCLSAAQSHNPIISRQQPIDKEHLVSRQPHQVAPQSVCGFQQALVVTASLPHYSPAASDSLSDMGCSQSSTYYFGIINVSFDHLDVLSFVLGVCFALGVSYCYSYCKHTRRASRHLLGKSGRGAAHGQQSSPFWSWPSTWRPADVPPGPPPPSAPSTTTVPWPTQHL